MNTIVFNSETANLSLEHLVNRLNDGGFEIRDQQGNVVALMLSPAEQEALTYAEARLDLDKNREQVRQALGRSGGISTAELLKKAALAAEKAGK
jgi:hypothetical protein